MNKKKDLSFEETNKGMDSQTKANHITKVPEVDYDAFADRNADSPQEGSSNG